jgi:hypothetical protein
MHKHGSATRKLSLTILSKNVIFSFFFFSYKKLEEGGTGPVLGVGTGGRGKEVGRGYRRVNMVQILYT